ncbi:MAG: TIGR02147 family protein [Bdellovibrionales bacterium]|nr:TIGR02147 family protein [Bdellovibrionales bacterium]
MFKNIAQLTEQRLDFRVFLQDTLVARCKSNPAYSLRAFARQLKLEPSYLSKILSGKRKVTPRLIQRLGSQLALDPLSVAQFIASEPVYHSLTVDQFSVIADWYHYAILELARTQGFIATPAYIAKRLGITGTEARSALERLQRLEMIELDSKGRLVRMPENHSTVGAPFMSAAFRKLQKQILEQAIHAMENVAIEQRDQSSLTMAIDPGLIPEAKLMIKKFRRDLCALLQSKGPIQKEVYQLSISLFPAKQNPKGALL